MLTLKAHHQETEELDLEAHLGKCPESAASGPNGKKDGAGQVGLLWIGPYLRVKEAQVCMESICMSEGLTGLFCPASPGLAGSFLLQLQEVVEVMEGSLVH